MDTFKTLAERDFEGARFQSFINDVAAWIARRPNELLSFDKVRRSLPIYGSSYRGLQPVPLDKIVGSATHRYSDFDRAFLPAQVRTKSRWKRIDELRLRDVALPPVQLYQVGDVYFVRDGHHRVSVARRSGQDFIDAEVVEMRTRVPLTALRGRLDARMVEAIGEYATFLDKTQLDKLRPTAVITFSLPGGYTRLLEHIVVHQYFMGLDFQRNVTWEEAVGDWYDFTYAPIAAIIGERNILKEFPNRTVGDLYLWITDHHYYLTQEEIRAHAYDVGFEQAAQDYVQNYSPRLARKIERAVRQWLSTWRHEHFGTVTERT